MKKYKFAFINDSVNFNKIDPSRLQFYCNIQKGVSDAVEKRGCQGDYFDETLPLLQFVENRKYLQYDGVLLLLKWKSQEALLARDTIACTVPCVSATTEPIGYNGHYVGLDDAAAVSDIVAHFVNEGYKKIGFIGTRFQSYALRRYEAFRTALSHNGLVLNDHHLFGPAHDYYTSEHRFFPERKDDVERYRDLDAASERMLYERILRTGTLPEAVLCENDLTALLFFACASDSGVRIPDDIAIAGIDGSRLLFGKRSYHFLTTAEQNFYDVGRNAVRVLYETVTGKRNETASRTLIPPRIIIRPSSRKSTRPESGGDAFFKQEVTAAIDRDYAAEDLARQISDDLMLTRRYFFIKFRKVFGDDFNEFLNNYRADRATYYLKNTDKPVSDILWDTGFHNHQNFIKFFKRRTGYTPTEYRRREK